jgi:hypothetical protein
MEYIPQHLPSNDLSSSDQPTSDVSFAVEHRGLFRNLWRNPGERDQVPEHPHGHGGDGDDD